MIPDKVKLVSNVLDLASLEQAPIRNGFGLVEGIKGRLCVLNVGNFWVTIRVQQF